MASRKATTAASRAPCLGFRGVFQGLIQVIDGDYVGLGGGTLSQHGGHGGFKDTIRIMHNQLEKTWKLHMGSALTQGSIGMVALT